MYSGVGYLSHDNPVDLELSSSEYPNGIDTSLLTKITASFGDILLSSQNQSDDPILWNKGGYVTGQIIVLLYGQVITDGMYRVPFVVYDSSHPHGLVWGHSTIRVVSIIEAEES